MNQQRINFALILASLFGLAMGGRLAYFQILENDYWKALALGQQKVFVETRGDRGEVFMSGRDGTLHPLAINRSWEFAYFSPVEMIKNGGDPEEISETLSEILGIDKEKTFERITRESSSFERLKNRLTPEEVSILLSADIPGLYIREENVRYYPHGELSSHIIGFVGGEGEGQYGIEGYYNEKLKGGSAFQEGERWLGGYLINKALEGPRRGEDLVLTIDYNIQFMAEKLLKESEEKLRIEGGTILVGDPHTGRILALANLPNFDPNRYSENTDMGTFKNSAIQDLFEPGSIFKSITMAIALEEKGVTPDTSYFDEGFTRIGGYTISNYGKRSWGQVTMTEVMEKSINTGAVYAEKSVGHDIFLSYLEKFGFFENTGIDLQGEASSLNLSFKEGYEINFANASFGQGIKVNSMHLFKAFSALANGGRLVNPHIVEQESVNPEGERIISPKTSSQITSMMISVTENGFAKTARVPGYYVAGKTGTAQVPWSSLGIPKKGYSDKTIQGFVGYAPAVNPSFVILVKLNNPNTQTAEYSAAPIFGELAKYLLNYYQIPPEREI